MKKNVDLTKLTEKEIHNKIKDLKRKSQIREDLGKGSAIFSFSGLFFSFMMSIVFMVPAIVLAGISVCGILTGWGLFASSIDCEKEIQTLTQELEVRSIAAKENKEIRKVKTGKTNIVIKRSTKNLENNENDLSL